jgi:Auxiliary Activity family 9 (formerly GH61)
MIIYLAKVSNAKTDTGKGNIWFKIHEEGYDPSRKLWATDILNSNGGKTTFKIPASLAPGDCT